MINFDKVKQTDEAIYNLIVEEYDRQDNGIELIASENIPSEAVLQAQASYHTLKYAEGYPEARYYGGCRIIDKTEQFAIERVCRLFECKYANVQPHSGAQANMAVLFAMCKPGDTIMGMSLNSGGHLTHGAKPTFSAKHFKAVQYEVDKETYLLDYDVIRKQAMQEKPRLLIVGASAYPRAIDFKKFREIVDDVNRELLRELSIEYPDRPESEYNEELSNIYTQRKCILMVDMAHIAGLVAAGLHQNPCKYADIITSTTHKTLRGPRGGIILTNNEEYIKKINKSVFPGLQGGPLENIIAAKAVCFKEALEPEFKGYQWQVIANAKALAEALIEEGFNVLTGGTDNHLILLDLRNKNITGKELESRLEQIHVITNKNAVPFDTENKMTTSGIRLGTPAITTRGMEEAEMKVIAKIISKCAGSIEEFEKAKNDLYYTVLGLSKKFPLYKN